MTGSPSRMPRDVHARERLRQAQQAEAVAVAAVVAAIAVLDRAKSKRDVAIAAAEAVVERAAAGVADAEVALIGVSGLDRAALLLGVNRAHLRKPRNTRAAQPYSTRKSP
jgi:hypothetical protein